MNSYSKITTFNESFENTSGLRGKSFNKPVSKLRNSSTGLNVSGSSITTDSSMLKNQDSFNIVGKPPRVPMLKTFQVKQKEKNDQIFVEIDDEKYYINEYR